MIEAQWGSCSYENLWLPLKWEKAELGQYWEWWRAAINIDEASLTCPLLTSCCAAWCHTSHGLVVLVCGSGVGDPCARRPSHMRSRQSTGYLPKQTLQKIPTRAVFLLMVYKSLFCHVLYFSLTQKPSI